MNAPQDVTRQGRKIAQVLEGARTIFMRDGFEGASVDEIAREAGVSKATLYSYFPDKRLLFMEVAKVECGRQAEAACDRIRLFGPPHEVLYDTASRMTRFFISPPPAAINCSPRISMGGACRMPTAMFSSG